MSVINTNLSSLIGQQDLKKSQSSLATSLERLSSGLRVNSAKDDAAGQAIGNRMHAQMSGLNQASRNANDGISMSQTAQGGLDQINDKLHRIRELTVQGLNETYNGEMGDKIQAEINLGLKEINRLTKVADYNGIPLLDGTAGLKNLQVGADDAQTLGLDLSPPGFSVEELGLQNLTFQGEPGTVAPVDVLSGSAMRVPIDSELTTKRYNPPENDPNLVVGSAGSPSRPSLIQYGGETGRLHNYSRAVSHDTDTLENDVSITTGTTAYDSTAREYMSSRTYLDKDGNELALSDPSIVYHEGKLSIQEQVGAQQYQYYEAELTIQGDENTVTAQALTDSPVTKTAPDEVPEDGINELHYTPSVQLATADYSVEMDGEDATDNDALTLVRLGSNYYVEEKLGEDNYAYYKADVTIKTGGDTDVVDVVSEREPSRTMVVEDQPFTAGSSTIHLKPSNNNVTVDYVDQSGERHENVMRSDDEGGYVFNIDEFVNAPGANKTAKVVRDQDGDTLLQTFNGMGEVILYHPMSLSSSTDVDNNMTTMTLWEDGPAQRIRNPPDPLAAIDRAIARVDEKRSDLGALENRIDSVIESNDSTATNLAAAKSRIIDADYAVETSKMVKSQILQQAGTSVLAQANQIPQNVLSLLG